MNKRDGSPRARMRRRTQQQEQSLSFQSLDELRASNVNVSRSDDSAVIRVNETLRLGHVLSIIPSLVLGRVGLSIEVASFLAVKHFNERSGEVLPDLPDLLEDCDIRLTYKPLNSEAQPLPSVRKLLENSPPNPSLQSPYPMAVLGSGYSIPSKSLAIIGGMRGIPQCSCCATSRGLDSLVGDNVYFTRTILTGEGESRAAAEYFRSLGVEHAAVLHVGELYAQYFAQDFKEAMKGNSVDAEYVLGDRDSAELAIAKIKKSEYRYIFVIAYVEDTVMLADLASKARVMGEEYVWIWAQGTSFVNNFQGTDVPDHALRALHGVGTTSLDTPVNTRYNSALQSFQRDEELQQYYISLQEDPGFFDTFDMSTLIALHFSLLNYDAAIAVGLAACRAESDLFTASELHESILETEFDGASGYVSFNNQTGTRSFQGMRYKVENVLTSKATDGTANFTAVATAKIDFESPNIVEVIKPFVYNDNTTTSPLPLPPLVEDPNLIGKAARGIGLALGAFIMFMCVGWSVWAYIHRKQQQVRAAQPFFLFMICLGTFAMASAIVPASFQEPMSDRTLNSGCMMFPWLFFLGFVTVFSALFTKVRRIYTLYQHSKAFRRIKIRPIDTLKPFAALLLLNIALLITWTFVAPLQWDRVDGAGRDRFGRPTDSYGSCQSENQKLSMTFGILLLVVNFIPVVLANYQTYQARSLPTQFNESKYIALSMASLLEAALLGLPIILVTKEDPTSHFLAQAVIIFIVCLAVLCFMFVPKWANKDKPAVETRYVGSTELSSNSQERRRYVGSTELSSNSQERRSSLRSNHSHQSNPSSELRSSSDRAFKWR